MNMAFNASQRRRRSALLCGAALGLLAAAPSWAQTIPELAGGNPAAGTTSAPIGGVNGATVAISSDSAHVTVDLRGRNQLLNWSSFNLGSSSSSTETVNFQDSTATAGSLAALNLINDANPSMIFGKITAASNISVWLSNPNGVVFGQTGAFSGGSLVLTTAAISAGDRAKFDATASGSLIGTIGLNNMGGAGVTISSTTANAGTTGINVQGNVIIAAQVVNVQGTLTASGDIALVAAKSVDVPADLGSNVGVTITAGTNVGSLSVGADGKITAGRILIGGAADFTTNLLLGIDPGATLSATAANGKVIIAAGTSSTETLSGAATRAVTVAPSAATSGTVSVALNGAIAAGSESRIDANGAITGTATAASVSGDTVNLNSSGGAVNYAGTLSGTNGVAVTSGGGGISLGSNVSTGPAGSGAVTISSAQAVTLGNLTTASTLSAAGDISVTALNGSIGSLGAYSIQSGTGTGTGSITLDQRTTGSINLSGSIIRAGTEATAGDGIYRGNFTIAGTTGDVMLGTVDAGSITLPGALPGDLIAERLTTRDDLAVALPTGSIRIDTAESRSGNVSLGAILGNISGRAITPTGDGRLLDGFGRTTVRALTDGKSISLTAGGAAQLGDLFAGTGGTTPSGITQIAIGATAVDLLTAKATTGNVVVTATGPGAAGTIYGNSIEATLGSVTVIAPGVIRGQSAAVAIGDGVRLALARARDLLSVDAGGNARLGDLGATDMLDARANGSITGLATVDVAAGPGLSITAGTTVDVGSSAIRPTRVALGTVRAAGAVSVFGAGISAQGIDTGSAVTLDALTGISVDSIGVTTRASSVTLKQATTPAAGTDTALLYATDEVLAPGFGGSTLNAGGALTVLAGRAPGTFGLGVAQISSATGNSVGVDGAAVSVGSAISTGGALNLTAHVGGLYLGSGSSAATATFTKTGAGGPTDQDEIRLLSAFTAVDTITATSATDLRGVSLSSTNGNISVIANNSVTGLRLPASLNDGRIDIDHGRLDLSALGSADATIAVTATAGTAQLGTVRAGLAPGDRPLLNQVTVIGTGVDIASATTLNGNMVLNAGAGGLRLGVGETGAGVVDASGANGGAGLVSTSNAQIGSLTAHKGDLSLRVDGTLSGLLGSGAPLPSVADGLTLGGSDVSGTLTLNDSGDIVYGNGKAGTVAFTAGGNVRIGTVTATGKVDVSAARSVTGLGAINTAGTGANLRSDTGSILLPAPTGQAAGVAAVLGTVFAAQNVTLSAGRVSARSITAGNAASVTAANGAVVDSLVAATGTISVAAAVPGTDTSTLTVDPVTGGLDNAFGFANIATTSTTQALTITATNGVAQLGTVTAGTGSTATTALGGTTGQIIVDAQAITAQRLFANNGSLRLTAHAGDLYLGMPADAPMASAVLVASAGDRALLDKQGATGLVTINGQLTAGASNVALIGNDDGVALITSTTDIRGRKVASNTGDVRLRAVGRIDALVSGTAAAAGVTLGTSASGTVTGFADVGGLVTMTGGDIRIGSLTSATAIRISASGSVTGLAPVTPGAGIALPFDISAARDVSVQGLAPPLGSNLLGSATLGRVEAGRDIGIAAGNVSVSNAISGGAASFSSTSGLFVGALSSGGDATLIDTSLAGAADANFVVDDTGTGNEALATGYGFANLRVNNGGVSGGSSPTGTIDVMATNVAQLGTVFAGLGATPLTDALGAARDQITVKAHAITATSVTSGNGGITLTASLGGLYADLVSAGTYATLTKQDSTGAVADGNELRVRTLTAGTTDAIGATRGDVAITSATAARIGAATSRTGSITINATDVTGMLRATLPSVTDLQLLPAYGASDLNAAGASLADVTLPATEPMQRIVVNASGVAKLGALDAGRGTTVAPAGVTLPQIAVTATAMDVASATSRNGDIRLETTTGRLRLGTGLSARSAFLFAGSTPGVVTDAEIGSLTARSGDITIRASGAVTGLKSLGDIVSVTDGLRIGRIDAGGADSGGSLRSGVVTVIGAGNVRLGDVFSTGALSVTAQGGSVTGLAGVVTLPAPAVTLLSASGNVDVAALGGSPRLGTAAITTITAGGNVTVNAKAIATGNTVAGANVNFIAGNALVANSITAATTATGAVTATTDTVGVGDVDNAVIAASTPVLANGFGAANLTARNPVGGFGTILVNATNGVAQLGTVRAGVASDGVTAVGGLMTNAAGVAPQVIVNAKAMSIAGLFAMNGAADLSASLGDIWLETGETGGYARLRKTGATGAVVIGTLTSGKQASSAGTVAADGAGLSLKFNGGTTLIDSGTQIRGNGITSLTGDILLRAVTAVTGRNPAAIGVTGDFTIGSVTAGGDVTLTSGGNMRLDSVTAAGAIRASAQKSVTGTNGTSGASGINLNAARGVDVRGSNNASLGLAALGTVSAGAPVKLENGSILPETVRVEAGQISATSIAAPSGLVTLSAGSALNVGSINAGTLGASTSSANAEIDNGLQGVPATTAATLAARFATDTLASGYRDAQLSAGNALIVQAGLGGATGGVAQLGPIHGSTILVDANAMVVRGGTVGGTTADDTLTLNSRVGALYLQNGVAGGIATLTKSGATDEVRIGSLTAKAISVDSATGIRAGTLLANGVLPAGSTLAAELTLLARAGGVTGLFLDGAADGRFDDGFGRAALSATAANARITVTATMLAQLGPVLAGSGNPATTAFDQITVKAHDIDAATLRPDANVAAANTTFSQNVSAANGNIVLTATDVLRIGKATAAANATFTAGGRTEIGSATATTGDISVTSTAGSISGLSSLPGTSELADARLLANYGRADLTAAAANHRVIVQAGPNTAGATTVAQLGNVLAGTGTSVTTTLDQIDIRAGKIDIATGINQSAVASNGNIRLRALGGRARLGVSTAASNVTIESNSDVDLLGQVSATGASSVITITNTGSNATEIGAGATAIATNQASPITAFALTQTEMNRLAAPSIIIDARANALTISTLTLGTNTGTAPATGKNTSLALLGTGAVTLTGAISSSAATTGRTLQIGGSASAPASTNDLVNPINIASSFTANLETGAGITWAGGIIDLRANRIVFGDTQLRGVATATSAADAISRLVSNPQSELYRGSLAGKTYLNAATLRVTYGNYALFQNSAANSSVTAGVDLGSTALPSGTALRLISTGDNAGNAFAMFGSINGFISSTAAIQPQPVIDYSTGSTANRVTLANSRVKGCAIGSAGAGCLASTPPPPTLSLFDEREIQLFRTDDNPDLQFESLIGTNNEGLIGDLATGAAATGCPTGKEASCPKPNEVKP